MVVRGRANTGFGSSARWCSVAVRGGGARFSSSVPRWTCVPCPVSRVSACSRVFRVPPCPGGWFGLLLVVRWSCVPCLVLYLASPRRAVPSLLCFSLLSFLLVLFLRLRLESQFQEKFSSFFFLFSRCFDSQPQTQGVISPGLQVSHHFF